MEDRIEEVATTILCDRHCHLGEGSNYDAATDTAWWVDILDPHLLECDLATGEVKVHTLPVMPSMVAFIDDAHQLLAAEDGLYVRDLSSGRLTLHTALEADNRNSRST